MSDIKKSFAHALKIATWVFIVGLAVSFAVGAWLLLGGRSEGQSIGAVNTSFHLTGSDAISVEAYDDPKADGVTCYVSRARVGGIKGALGIAEDKTEASIACRQTKDQVTIRDALPASEDMFTERMSGIFKKLHVVRMVDPQRNVLLYLTFSDKVLDGSAKNSLTAVYVSRSTPIRLK
jgi:CreA protein